MKFKHALLAAALVAGVCTAAFDKANSTVPSKVMQAFMLGVVGAGNGGSAPPAPPAVTATFISSLQDTTDSTTWTFSAVAVGTPSANRKIFVGIHLIREVSPSANASPAISAITVEGNAPTVIDSQATTTSGPRLTAAYWIDDATNSTVDIAITADVTCTGVAICVYTITTTTDILLTSNYFVGLLDGTAGTITRWPDAPDGSAVICFGDGRSASGAGKFACGHENLSNGECGRTVSFSPSAATTFVGVTEDDDDTNPSGTTGANFALAMMFSFAATGAAEPWEVAGVYAATASMISPTTIGQVELKATALGTKKPKAALFFMTNHTSANDSATGTVNAAMSYGAATSPSARAMARFMDEDNIATSDAYRNLEIDKVVALFSGTGTDVIVADVFQFIGGGCVLDFTTVNATARRVSVVFFAGIDVDANVGVKNLGAASGTTGVTGVGFTPDVVFAFGDCGPVTTLGNAAGGTFGMAVNDGTPTQYCTIWALADAIAAGDQPSQITYNNRIAGEMTAGGTTVAYEIDLTTFDVDGFTLNRSASPGNDDLAYLALKFNGAAVFKLFGYTLPTATGSKAITDPAFSPDFGMIVNGGATAYNTAHFNDTEAGTYGSGFFDGTAATGMGWFVEAGTDPTNNSCALENVAHISGNNKVRATLTSFDANGWTLNYSIAPATARVGFGFALL